MATRPAGWTMAGMVRLRIKDGSLADKEFVFTRVGRCTVGRAGDCELRLPTDLEHVSVSRHHCMLHMVPPRLWVRDLRSRNGTRINGMQIGHPAAWPTLNADNSTPLPIYELHDGDDLELAGTTFEVCIDHPVDCPVHLVDVEEEEATCAVAGLGNDLGDVSSPVALSI